MTPRVLGIALVLTLGSACTAPYQLDVHQYAYAAANEPDCPLALVPATHADLWIGGTPDGKYQVIGRMNVSNLADPNATAAVNLDPIRQRACAMGGNALAITSSQSIVGNSTYASAAYTVLRATDPSGGGEQVGTLRPPAPPPTPAEQQIQSDTSDAP